MHIKKHSILIFQTLPPHNHHPTILLIYLIHHIGHTRLESRSAIIKRRHIKANHHIRQHEITHSPQTITLIQFTIYLIPQRRNP